MNERLEIVLNFLQTDNCNVLNMEGEIRDRNSAWGTVQGVIFSHLSFPAWQGQVEIQKYKVRANIWMIVVDGVLLDNLTSNISVYCFCYREISTKLSGVFGCYRHEWVKHDDRLWKCGSLYKKHHFWWFTCKSMDSWRALKCVFTLVDYWESLFQKLLQSQYHHNYSRV